MVGHDKLIIEVQTMTMCQVIHQANIDMICRKQDNLDFGWLDT